mmetsp:Transcript_11697/g.19999  ORF Transcript_11697/g.19999 Transcript_11697/m.19999 type:complete len:420 (-) Transcript_11697:180-1439(-)
MGETKFDELISDLVKVSSFVYGFRDLRAVVKKNKQGTIKKRSTGWFSSEEYKVEYVTPAHIITQKGSQQDDKNQYLKYDITLPAIKQFLEENRKWFKLEDGAWKFDESRTEKKEPFPLEKELDVLMEDNLRIIDYDDEFTEGDGGLVYGVAVNLTHKWITVVFRGSVGKTDFLTDRDFNLDYNSFFKTEGNISGGKPGTHAGFTKYLVDEKMGDQDGRKCLDRILACVNNEFETNKDVAGKDFSLYVTGHSLGGGLANLFAFRVAQLKAMNHESVKFLPNKVTALTFAAPVAGNHDYNKEFQSLEKKGILRHIRVANEGDAVPTNEIPLPFSLALAGNSHEYTQNGVNLHLFPDKELAVDYRNTKPFNSQFFYLNPMKSAETHFVAEYIRRVELPANKNSSCYQKTVEEIYAHAGDCTN